MGLEVISKKLIFEGIFLNCYVSALLRLVFCKAQLWLLNLDFLLQVFLKVILYVSGEFHKYLILGFRRRQLFPGMWYVSMYVYGHILI